MILKEIDEKPLKDKYAIAGNKAEKQMAFYLKREFGDSEDIYVINDLRLVDGEEVAQIDSLIVHKFGFVIIESKSVTQKIKINSHGEWMRVYNSKEMGMPSPIKQAERQKKFLVNYLNKYAIKFFKNNVVNKLLPKPSYDKFHCDIFVAISDEGVIIRDGFDSEVVLKADRIPEKVNELIKKYNKDSNSLSLTKITHQFYQDTLEKIAKFLKRSHKKKIFDSNIPEKSENKYGKYKKDIKSLNKYKCSKCGSSNMIVTYGKYGYYFKCKDCNGNTAISEYCNICKEKMKIKKDKNNFYIVCSGCGISKLFFTNRKFD